MTVRIGYLGPKGTFTKLAVQEVFPDEEALPYQTIPACIDAVQNGEVDYSVVPLENAIEGSVNLTLDYLIHEQKLPIVGEIVVPIRQHLMTHPNRAEGWLEIEAVYSHSHAIAQCHQFLHKHLPHIDFHYTKSTGAAAEFVKDNPHLSAAAIGNELAAKEYGLEIVKSNIHDYENNHTRFVVLHREGKEAISTNIDKKGDRTTFMITLPSDYAGALHQVLSAFSWRKLNLSKIESRPMKTGLGNYFFVVDVEMKLDDVLLPGVKAELEALGCSVSILGSYPYYHVNQHASNHQS